VFLFFPTTLKPNEEGAGGGPVDVEECMGRVG
jgi:hypothetical protein